MQAEEMGASEKQKIFVKAYSAALAVCGLGVVASGRAVDFRVDQTPAQTETSQGGATIAAVPCMFLPVLIMLLSVL